MTDPISDPESLARTTGTLPENVVYSLLEPIARTLEVCRRLPETLPDQAAGVVLHSHIAQAVDRTAFSHEEDEAFRNLRERFLEMWRSHYVDSQS